jgi:putative ABC transport system substrate-binding protein
MILRTLRLDRIGRLSASLVAAALLLGSPSFAPAQTPRLPKVGYLGFGASVPPTLFQNRMRELGYSEGKEVTVEYRFAGGRPGELPRLARELVDAKVDVILAIGDEAIVAAKNATPTVPIVMVACDALITGFVASLARPGGNLTGMTCITSELMPKRMALSASFCRLRPASWSFTTQRTSVSPLRRRALSGSRKSWVWTPKPFSSARPKTSSASFPPLRPIAPMCS